MNPVYAGLEPTELWRHFDALNRIPRPSGLEAASREYVQRIAKDAGLTWRTDAYGNCVVSLPARGGSPVANPVAIQAHLDMVKATANGVTFDFDRDPIVPRRDGGRIYATGTTLGADNGIGASAMLALITSPDLAHGPLELLFTVEEETGLHGAVALDASIFSARMLVNLDGEDPSRLTVGCAGGETLVITLPVTRTAVTGTAYKVSITGLQGGHSGVQIHEARANAIKLLTGVLVDARLRELDFDIISITGGSAHNAIPKDAEAIVVIPVDSVDAFHALVGDARGLLDGAWATDEPGIKLAISECEADGMAISDEESDQLLNLLDALPTGVTCWSETFPGKVQTSNNVAEVNTTDTTVELIVSIRSFIASDIDDVRLQIEPLAAAAGASVARASGYPGWAPDKNSKLLETSRAVYENIAGVAPEVDVVHAGLECGVIIAKRAGMEAISFGSEIGDAHSPNEHVEIKSVEMMWKMLVELLKRLAE